ncbi:restriction endonuclease subunit S [Limimaricola soesokkakensis]|nr:restriction endonuclease subunit S [Limimaricola soesokkakensis]
MQQRHVDVYPPNSIYLIGIGGTLGKANISRVAASCNQQFNVIEAVRNFSPEWILTWLNSSRELIFNQTDYTTMPIMNQAKTKRLPIPVPPLSEQVFMLAEISRFRAKISSAISLKKDQIAALKEYKTSLINAAVTGKIQVTSDSLHETGQDMDACSELKLNEYA